MEDVGMLKPKKYAKVRRLTQEPKLNKLFSYNPKWVSTCTIKQNTKSCTYVVLYRSGLFYFGSYVNLPTLILFTYFLGFDILTSFSFIENVFYYTCFHCFFF